MFDKNNYSFVFQCIEYNKINRCGHINGCGYINKCTYGLVCPL